MSARRQRVLAFLTDAAEEAKAYSLDNTHLSLSGKLEVEKWLSLSSCQGIASPSSMAGELERLVYRAQAHVKKRIWAAKMETPACDFSSPLGVRAGCEVAFATVPSVGRGCSDVIRCAAPDDTLGRLGMAEADLELARAA